MNFIKWVRKIFLSFFKKIFQNIGSVTTVIATIVTAVATGVLAYYNWQTLDIIKKERAERLTPAVTVSGELNIKYKDRDESIKILNKLDEENRFIPLDRSDLFQIEYSVKNIGIVPVTFSILNYDPDLFINNIPGVAPITEYNDPNLNKNIVLTAGEIKSFEVGYEINEYIKNVFRDSKNKVIFKLQPRIQYKAMDTEKSSPLDVQFYCVFFVKDSTKLYPTCNVLK